KVQRAVHDLEVFDGARLVDDEVRALCVAIHGARLVRLHRPIRRQHLTAEIREEELLRVLVLLPRRESEVVIGADAHDLGAGDRGRENVLAFRPWRREASMRAIPSSRRSFLVGTASLTAGLMLPRLADAQPAPSRPLVPRETFFGDPDVASAQISFDGAWVAY